jgi:uncharacterized iron-regulated membrane protein
MDRLLGSKFIQVADRFGAGYPPGTWDGATSTTVGSCCPTASRRGRWATCLSPRQDDPSATSTATARCSGIPATVRCWTRSLPAPNSWGFPPGFTVTVPEDETGSYVIGLFPDADPQPDRSAVDERIAYIDQYTAEPLGDYRYDQFGPLGKATDLGISLHEGREWGLISQLFVLVGALAILMSAATAIVMWRKRRPTGLGAPRKEPDRRLGIGVVVITAVLGALFPLLGLTLLVVLAFDFLVVRRVPRLARTLGAV